MWGWEGCGEVSSEDNAVIQGKGDWRDGRDEELPGKWQEVDDMYLEHKSGVRFGLAG